MPPAETTSAIQERLRRLIARGFQFIHPTGPEGTLEAVVGVRVHNNVMDVVQLHAENDVSAARMAPDEANLLAPKAVFWRSAGNVATVLDELLALPDTGAATEQEPTAATGCWVSVRPGEAKWVNSST